MSVQSVTVDLPEELVRQLVQVARTSKRTLSDVVRDRLLIDASTLPPLPTDVERELAAFSALSDDLLWQVATTLMTPAEQTELARLNQQAQSVGLSSREQMRQAQLIDRYQHVMVRRAEAVAQLQSRGHDVRSLFVVPPDLPQ